MNVTEVVFCLSPNTELERMIWPFVLQAVADIGQGERGGCPKPRASRSPAYVPCQRGGPAKLCCPGHHKILICPCLQDIRLLQIFPKVSKLRKCMPVSRIVEYGTLYSARLSLITLAWAQYLKVNEDLYRQKIWAREEKVTKQLANVLSAHLQTPPRCAICRKRRQGQHWEILSVWRNMESPELYFNWAIPWILHMPLESLQGPVIVFSLSLASTPKTRFTSLSYRLTSKSIPLSGVIP
ncbi:uncharacterized protein LOC142829926 [Pelodiscus sinensis]|uniref:uncharacterized protein LOC142829926 n=1 Tax=Pelodiscus sinensis TaxID=13735 RepID=UPI003F6AB13C